MHNVVSNRQGGAMRIASFPLAMCTPRSSRTIPCNSLFLCRRSSLGRFASPMALPDDAETVSNAAFLISPRSSVGLSKDTVARCKSIATRACRSLTFVLTSFASSCSLWRRRFRALRNRVLYCERLLSTDAAFSPDSVRCPFLLLPTSLRESTRETRFEAD